MARAETARRFAFRGDNPPWLSEWIKGPVLFP